ncbi:hypothetical protein MADE_1014780 [Alteromonas mediterranea DE]|uniref:Uncharacterized protein n=1 Tax=Alteromonas mediterranea (strain DSM 17117 / CIP 110805 / LMG 28347 / Deep ecotype) TaxID=1774373 RepID=F2GCD4_ALTMD|nr:hypothetical protein MADE_1014780 [Alteromonas mediterranea DE]
MNNSIEIIAFTRRVITISVNEYWHPVNHVIGRLLENTKKGSTETATAWPQIRTDKDKSHV